MVLVSYTGKEINAKLVFYGPGLCGKTTNLEYIYGSIPSNSRGKMVSMKTKTERTLFFDFLPIDLGELAGFKTRFLLYTVPGQVYYNATRKLVLKGVDAVVFVADSERGKMEENLESFENLKENLNEHGIRLDEIPYVLQYNKRDLPDVYSVDELDAELNKDGVPSFEAVATKGDGVFDTFKVVSKLLLAKLSKEIGAPVKQSESVLPQKTRPTPKPSVQTPAQIPEPRVEPPSPVDENVVARPATAKVEPKAADSPKSRGLWRWFKQDGQPAEKSTESVSAGGDDPPPESSLPAAQSPPPESSLPAAQSPTPESSPAEPSQLESPQPVAQSSPPPQDNANVKQELSTGEDQITGLEKSSRPAPYATVEKVEEQTEATEESKPVAAIPVREISSLVATGDLRVDENEISIPIRIPAEFVRQQLVIRLEIHVTGEIDEEDQDLGVA